MSIYFDNSATTLVSEKAAAAALRAMREDYGNPSSLHRLGVAAQHALNQARAELAALLRVNAGELYFNSGGSEGDNTVLFGAAQALRRRGQRIIISAIEHPAVAEAAKRLAAQGFDVCHAPVDSCGVVDVAALSALANEQTILVSVMQVNNEVGSIQPLAEIGAAVKQAAPQALFHIDAVQGFGRVPVDVQGWRADALTVSGHKIHAPKGVGLLWLRKGARIAPYLLGGGQERGLRSGTENVPGVMALAAAAEELFPRLAANAACMAEIKEYLATTLRERIDGCALNGPPPGDRHSAPHILNMSFAGLKSEVLLHSLEARGLYAGSGSACSSHSDKGSPVLKAMRLPAERIDSALRFSFCPYNTMDEARQAAEIVIEEATALRQLYGKMRR
ncbi:MAG: cysteine desulfurase family protein [Bacillota bacterium]|nr:cysteine desulfurase family protein [Bacillota bacterium]